MKTVTAKEFGKRVGPIRAVPDVPAPIINVEVPATVVNVETPAPASVTVEVAGDIADAMREMAKAVKPYKPVPWDMEVFRNNRQNIERIRMTPVLEEG